MALSCSSGTTPSSSRPAVAGRYYAEHWSPKIIAESNGWDGLEMRENTLYVVGGGMVTVVRLGARLAVPMPIEQPELLIMGATA